MRTSDQEETLNSYVGKRVKIEKLGHFYSGNLKDKGEVVAVKTVNSMDRLWVLEDGSKEHHFASDDGWVVSLI